MADKPTLFMIGNTHFDPVWLWTWDEAMASIRATFRSALARMEEEPDFRYSFATPPVFRWIEDTDPALFDEIRSRVADGHWELAEGFWNQPDCYTGSGESYVRHALYGQAYLTKVFGKRAVSVMQVDSFGHSPQLPQILRKAGMHCYLFTRPEAHHVPLPAPLFHWEGMDGSVVTAFRIGGEAGGGWSNDLAAEMDIAARTPGDKAMLFGVTDHGGAPTIRDIATIRERSNARFSTVAAFFASHENDDMPTVQGEWITGDFGPYANGTEVKKNNRRAENALLAAESALCLAEIADPTRREALTAAWQDTLFNQFHDILGGCCIPQAYVDARDLHGKAIATANRILHTALQRITAKLRMPGENPEHPWNIVVWNPTGTAYDGYVETEVQWAHEFGWYNGEIALEDANGAVIPCQVICERSVIPAFRSRFVFRTAVPAYGCRIYKLLKRGGTVPAKTLVTTADTVLHTARYEITLSPDDGSIRQIRDRRNGKILCENAFVPVCLDDPGDTWAFNVTGYGTPRGKFRRMRCEIVEDGELLTKWKLHSILEGGASSLTMYYTFYHDAAYIDLTWRLDWHEKMAVCKLCCAVGSMTHVASAPYCEIERGEGAADRPMGTWLRYDDALVVTDSLFAYTMTEHTLGFTLVRSPIYGDLRIAPIDTGYDYPVMEQGISAGRLRFYPEGSTVFAPQAAEAFTRAPIVLCEANHDGTAADRFTQGVVTLDAARSLLTAVKYAEDGDGIVCRMVQYGDGEKAVLHVNGADYPLTFGKNEIKTVRIAHGICTETNLLEEAL